MNRSSETNATRIETPYRIRFQATFSGERSSLIDRLKELFDELEVIYLDNPPLDKTIDLVSNIYELEGFLNTDYELEIKVFCQKETDHHWKITFDLDSPVPIDIPFQDDFFLTVARLYFPTVKLIYNYLPSLKIRPRPSTSGTRITRAQEWIKDHRDEYRGRWVVLQDGQLIASRDSAAEIAKILDNNTDRVFVTLVT